ncbi:MAG: DUF3301 domain-containing protein [Gammaproteobacteria bacterium]|jgi:hypothetical protein
MLAITFALILAAGAYWLWANNMQFRERAVHASGAACRDLGMQLLDQTVALRRWRVQRTANGRFQAQRVYIFEYSADGLSRCVGRVVFSGERLDYICFEQSGRPMIFHCGRVFEDARQRHAAVEK